MNITVDNTCNYLEVATVDEQYLEDWYSGSLLDVRITTFFNCNQVKEEILPNQYQFNNNITNCVSGLSSSFTLNITGIDISYIQSIQVSSSTNVFSATEVTSTEWLIVSDSSLEMSITFDIIDINGHAYQVRFTEVSPLGDVCTENALVTSVVYPTLSNGLVFDNITNILRIYNAYLNNSTDITTLYCDGIYSITLVDITSCIFVNCSTECEVIDKYAETQNDILKIYQAIVIASTYTSQGRTDCITCEQLCDVYNKLLELLGKTDKLDIIKNCSC